MRSSLKADFNRRQRRALCRALVHAIRKTKVARMVERYQAIKLALEGLKNTQIAKIISRTSNTVAKYVNSFREGGMEALFLKKSPVRPRFLSPEQEQQMYEIIVNSTPAEQGFLAEMNWTAPLVQAWIKKQYGVNYADRSVRELMYRLGMSFTAPTYRLAKADPEKQKAFLARFECLRKQLLDEKIDRILFIDETMIRDYQALSRTWFPKGRQKVIKTYGKHWGTKIIGALDYETGEVFCIQEDRYKAVEFLRFLKRLTQHYSGERIVLILDNARIHHAKLLRPFLQENADTLSLEFLPPYSPELNPIEGLWGWMKSSVINNVFFPTVSKIRVAVAQFLRRIDQERDVVIDRLCVQL